MKVKIIPLLCLLALPLLAQYELETILGAPYCTQLVVSKDGHQLAWEVLERGIRSLYTAESPAFDPSLQYQSAYDDGQIIRNLGFDHSGTHLFFVKGSTTNRLGEIANPASEAIYPQRALIRLNLETNRIDTVGSFDQYIISPDDSFVLAPERNKLFKVELASMAKELILEMRGVFSNISFHPSGDEILFVSNRNDHSFIGHYVLNSERIEWIAPSVYRDQHPVWSLDGAHVAFIRAPGRQKGELADITAGNPFSINVYDLKAKRMEETWSSPGDDGGFAQYYHPTPLRWTSDGNLLFYSEHEDWMKIYRLDVQDGKAVPILGGDCEMEHSHLSADGRVLVYSANCDDIDRRDIWRYNIETESNDQLSMGDAIETNPLILADHGIAYRSSSHHRPTGVEIRTNGEVISLSQMPTEFPKSSLVVPRQVVFRSADGKNVHGQLFHKGNNDRKPAVLFMHGGPIRQMLLGYHYSSYYANAYAFNQYLASRGYVVLSVNYRAGIGYGKAFRRAPSQGPRGASEYQDIVAAARYLQSLEMVDGDRIGLWGGSYGGLLTAQGLARNSDIFKAGVDFHGVHDWSWRATDFSDGGFWGIKKDSLDQAFQYSPVADIDGWTSPVLLIHGDDDRNVMFGQTVDLVERLKKQGVEYEVLVFPDEVHGFYRYESWLKSFEAAAIFLDRYLKRQ